MRVAGRPAVSALVAGLVLAATACGQSEFHYLESDDGHVFAKVPSDWKVVREGGVALRYLVNENLDLAFARGDSTFPWRADFRADDGTPLVGYVEGQHIDARFRPDLLLRDLIGVDLDQIGATDIELQRVSVADVEGYRVTYSLPKGDGVELRDEVRLIDDRRSGVYTVSIGCSEECFEQHREIIDEILTTFRVEP